MAVQAHDELDVLADRRARVPPDRLHERAAEQPERAGDDEQRVHVAPADPPDQEGAEVLEHLEDREAARGQPHVEDAAVVDPAPVRDAHDPPGGHDDVRRGDDRPDDPEQRVLLEDRVGVDREDVREPGGVDARVERVGLPAVLLVHHPEAAVPARDVHAADRGGRDHDAEGLPDRDEVELLLEPLERAVERAVVHDDHLVLGVAQREERMDAVDDRRFLVERGDEHRDRRRHRGGEDLVVGGVPTRPEVPGQAAPGDGREHEVDEVEEREVRERERGERDREVVQPAHRPPFGR